MNDSIINELMRQAEAEETPAELRRLGRRLQDLGQTDYAAFCFRKAHRIEQELAESVNA
jgi:hypothetical protein